MPVLEVVTVPPCAVVLLERWDAPPGRFYAAYRTRGSFRWLLGHPVVDEFATLSSPIFVGPRALLGQLYDVGISLGHRRDAEMGLDLGWPPLCVGLDRPALELPPNWQQNLLDKITASPRRRRPSPAGVELAQVEVGDWRLERARLGEATVLGTSAPLLPRQLRRLCETASTPAVVAVATGNRLERPRDSRPAAVTALSEARFAELEVAARGLAA